MSRKAREQSPTDFYHVMIRGINKEKLFENKQHKQFLIDLLKKDQEDSGVEIVSFCIMDTHAHFILKGNLTEISQFIKKINIRFAMRYNSTYGRVGHVFQDRFRSENIYNDNHLFQAISYVHNNPVKAGIVGKVSDYKWSSYQEYFTETDSIVSENIKSLILDIAGSKRALKEFHKNNQSILFIDTKVDIQNMKNFIFDDILKDYCEKNGINDASQIRYIPEKIDNLIIRLLNQNIFTHREIADLLEVNRNLVHILNNRK